MASNKDETNKTEKKEKKGLAEGKVEYSEAETIPAQPAGSPEESAPLPPADTSFWRQGRQFFATYKPEISLAVLILYVITLLIATIVELIEH